MGILLAALFGALSITSEFRYGTIRPIFLATPRRGRVIAAKVVVAMLLGALKGLAATAVSAAVGRAVLIERGLRLHSPAGITRGCWREALWSVIGVGVGGVVRNEVSAIVGLCTWLLFLEGPLLEDLGLSSYGRLLPGALAQAAAGLQQQATLAPGLAVSLLAVYAEVAALAGCAAISRRDVA